MAGRSVDRKARCFAHSGCGGYRALLDQPSAWAAADEARALRCLVDAADKLNAGDEAGAQRALDASGLSRLSPDGAALAGSLDIASLDLPQTDAPRLWRADDIAAHVALFRDYAPAAGLLAKAGGWDESKHPRVPAGSPGGGQFQGGQDGGVGEGRSAVSGDGGNGDCRRQFRPRTRLPKSCVMFSPNKPADC
jgi:hypothetical protein